VPRIFDNIEERLLPALQETLGLCHRGDFCVGYFNLRGWRQLHESIENWSGGEGHCCRLLVGMQQMPQDQLRHSMSLAKDGEQIDQATAIALKRKLAQDFRDQLMVGIPTNADEKGLPSFGRFANTVCGNSQAEFQQCGDACKDLVHQAQRLGRG